MASPMNTPKPKVIRARDPNHDDDLLDDASLAKKYKMECSISSNDDVTDHSSPPKSNKNTKQRRVPYHKQITPGIYSPPNSLYSQVVVPTECIRLMPMIIGKVGYHFKNITSISGATYIWFNKESNVIEVWGPKRCHEYASRLLLGHIHACFIRNNEREERKKNHARCHSSQGDDEGWNVRTLPSPDEDENCDMEDHV